MSEYRLAQVSGALRSWLKEGAPSDDAEKAPGRRFSSA
jgi:hypothetical protein